MTTETLSLMGNSLGHPLLDVRVDVRRSVDHVRVVRMLVKHLHVFMNVNMNNNLAITSHNEMDEASYRYSRIE